MAFRKALLVARVVAVSGNRVLLAHHRHPDGRDFWCFPGGHVEEGEGVVAAAARELQEEAGLRAEIARVVFLQEFTGPPGRDVTEVFFEARVADGGALSPTLEPNLVELAWVPLDRLPHYRVLPEELSRAVYDGRWRQWRLPLPPVHTAP